MPKHVYFTPQDTSRPSDSSLPDVKPGPPTPILLPHIPPLLSSPPPTLTKKKASTPQKRIPYQNRGLLAADTDNTAIPSTDDLLRDFLPYMIIGAEFDPSVSHPPRCHPGTRLGITQRCLDFIVECDGPGKLLWVVGPAKIGKSAVMRMVVENAPADIISASLFLPVKGRHDGSKVILTIAYQLALKCKLYRQFVGKVIGLCPALLEKPLSVQFEEFIVEPFIHGQLSNAQDRFLVVIDGLDQLDGPFTQEDILELISNFCITYPTSRIAWIVASRPEPHITSFFERVQVQTAYIKEEITMDSDGACENVQRYLRDKLHDIKLANSSLDRRQEWPSEIEFAKIATAAGGLYAFASLVVQYIGDPRHPHPDARLHHVLQVIDNNPKDDLLEGDHPLAELNALYNTILSRVLGGVVASRQARKLLLLCLGSSGSLRFQCNLLGFSKDVAYLIANRICSVVKVPKPDEADDEPLQFFHQSFTAYLCDYKRSKFSLNALEEAQQLLSQCSLRIAKQVSTDSDGMAGDKVMKYENLGYLKGGPGLCGSVSLSWPNDSHYNMADDELRLRLYSSAVASISFGFKAGTEAFVNVSCFRVLTTRFTVLGIDFPFTQVRDFAFDKLRLELIECGTLKEVPLRTLDYAAICGPISLQFTRLKDVGLFDVWDSSCLHEKEEAVRGWSTCFGRYEQDDWSSDDDDVTSRPDIKSGSEIPRFNFTAGNERHWYFLGEESLWAPKQCNHCLQRLARHFLNNPDQLSTVFIDSTGLCYTEMTVVDSKDGGSQWRYRFFHSGPPT